MRSFPHAPPSIHQCSVLKLLVATLKGKKLEKGFEDTTGIELGTFLTEGHALTDFADPCSESFSIKISSCLKFQKKVEFDCLGERNPE